MVEPETLTKIRHSLAHVLAMAVKERDPAAKLAIGPAIETGFYYDFELSKPLSPEDLPSIEARMKELVKQNIPFKGSEIKPLAARELFENEPYKLELIDQFTEEGKTLTMYESGVFTDLCAGGHVANTKEIDLESFSLDKIAGAYWRGDEKNKMLTRIYGLAFSTKDELEAYQKRRSEAAERDHRKIGKELGLFVFSSLVGPGLPLWTPRGTILRNELDTFVWSLREKRGYQKVAIPHITKKDLYETSGHWEKFAEELFHVSTREGKEFALKPMNCPHHTQIYASEKRSYRELPIRYAETTIVYRDEQSGELSGLSRVLSITQDDAHVFTREKDIHNEVFSVWDIIDEFYRTIGLPIKHVRLSFHDLKYPEKYLGTKSLWEKAEKTLRDLATDRGTSFREAPGEAALYGPKIDFIAEDSIGREWQVATIQLDMNLPERFSLSCVNEQGEDERIVMIHAAIMGSLERFLAMYIEHTGGAFPLWLSPLQVAVLPVSETHHDYAKSVEQELIDAGIRAKARLENETLGAKIRATRLEKVPYFIVVGDKEKTSALGTLEKRGATGGATLSVSEIIKMLTQEVREKRSL